MVPARLAAAEFKGKVSQLAAREDFLFRLLDILFQPGQSGSCSGGMGANPPFVDRLDRQCIQIIEPLPPLADRHDQLRAFEHPQMLHHGAAPHLFESVTKLGSGERTQLQRIANCAPDGIGQSLEDGIEIGVT